MTMSYRELRTKIKTGDLFFWKGTSIYSRIISAWTKSPYTHVGMAWVVGGRVLILQADISSGVEVIPVSGTLPLTWVSMDKKLSDKALCVALDRLNEPYSLTNAIRAGLGLRPIRGGYQCVQYVLTVLRANGFKGYDLESLTPGNLVSTLLDKGYTFTTIDT